VVTISSMTGFKKNISSKKKSDIFCHCWHPNFELNKIGMKKSPAILIQVIRFLLILLWVYVSTTKLLEFDHFKIQMQIQTLSGWLSHSLVYVLPATELSAAALLFFRKTFIVGLFLSLILMILFTGYIGLVLCNYFGRMPCSCGGVLSSLNWKSHLLFNIFFLLLTSCGLYIVYRERRVGQLD
jgi:putative oxidoreductase